MMKEILAILRKRDIVTKVAQIRTLATLTFDETGFLLN